MKAYQKALQTLEFDKILSLLSRECSVEAAREKILSITPSSDAEEISLLQRQTSAAKKIAAVKGSPSLSAHSTLPDIIERARKGASLNPAELLRIASLLSSVSHAISYIGEGEGIDSALREIFRRLLANRALEEEIKHCILSEESISDDASPELFSIRRKMNSCAAKIRESLQHYISGAYSNFLQENIITFRNSRYVIPVKSEYKNEIRGLVHDTSSSGATVFIEPLVVVELNNQIKLLEGEEKKEIDRILLRLSSEVASFSAELELDFYNVVELSVIFARASLSYRMDACEAKLSPKGILRLDKARHPLLPRATAVPISVELGLDFDTLVITGPNTGGKTVTLKTIGLLSLMAQSGMHIPAEEAQIPVFSDVLADIGDEQSIEQSLSTFSSHMVNIVDMIAKAGKGALVLFDELGSGTDPVEGAALAEAILEKIRLSGAKCVATTHYPELKTYALETERVENASCEFDITTLKPTYRLILGAPGRSNAFLISERLGMPQEIIESANLLIKAENRRFEAVVEKLEEERVMMEKSRSQAEAARLEAEKIRANAVSERDSLLEGAQTELERAKKEALRLVKSARAAFDETFDKLDELRKKAEKAKNLELLEKEREKLRGKLFSVEKDVHSQVVDVEENNESYRLPRPLRVGDTVLVTTVNKEGTVEKLGREVTLLVGNLRMKADPASLRLITDLKSKKKKERRTSSSPRTAISASCDVRGLVTDDAWFVVDKYLDDVILTGLGSVTIIHGKGTGALKKGLWQYFKKDPRIKSFRLGLYGEGDGGVTILEMK